MKLLHQLGHASSWNAEVYYENQIGDGFIFNAYSHDSDSLFQKKIGRFESKKLVDMSLIDLQFYWSRDTREKNFSSYSFHPRNMDDNEGTQSGISWRIIEWVSFQETKGVRRIIVPNITISSQNFEKALSLMETANKKIQRKPETEYYMTVALAWDVLVNRQLLDKLLLTLTETHIQFDGYYFVHEVAEERLIKKKINVGFSYLEGVWSVLSALKSNWFRLIYGFSNWDALVFLSLTDIDYISIGTFENLRHFNHARFTITKSDWGPSEGWYFSEKILNFIKAAYISQIRLNGGIGLIKNKNNIYSDHILSEGFVWSSLKPEIHKNYLLSVSRFLKEIDELPMDERIDWLLEKITNAEETYAGLQEKKIFLLEESSDYHLAQWKSFLLSKK